MNDFYVYAWLMPCGTPFYIGKGRKGRDRALKVTNQIFMRIVDKIRRAGKEPVIFRVLEGLDENGAFELERALIKSYGRRNNKTGILANMTDGGEGSSGHVKAPDVVARIAAAKIGVKLPPASDERKAKISAANTGRKRSAESIELNKVAQHTVGLSVANKSGFRGVSFHSDRGKWGARIMIDGREYNLGRFDSAEDAAIVRDRAAIAAFGKNNCFLNFPDKAA